MPENHVEVNQGGVNHEGDFDGGATEHPVEVLDNDADYVV